MKIFEVVWTDYKQKKNYIIGRLVHDEHYQFRYNQNQIYDAIKNGFRPFVEFPNIDLTYVSKEIFKTFAIRIPSINRDEIDNYLGNGAELATDRIKIYCRTDVSEK